MNFPNIIKKRIKGLGVVEIRPYLTTALIDSILEVMANTDYAYAFRQSYADALVLTQCTNLADFHTENEEVDIEVVDSYRANGFIKAITKEIKDYDILMRGLENLSVKDITNKFSGAMDEFTNEFKNINLEEQQNKLKETLDELKQAEAEKEAILNGK